jgi:hypothetical protein
MYRIGRLLSLTTLAMLAAPIALPASDAIKGFGSYRSEHETVELFDAIGKGLLEVRLIPRDSAQVRLLVENKSGKPLNVAVPAALGASPVLAQFQGVPGFNNGAMDNAPQQLGIGAPAMQNQGGNPLLNLGGQNANGVPGIGIFNLAPEVVGQMKLVSVCLEHGKPNPRPTIRYELKRLEEVTSKPEVYEVCAMLGRGEISQKAAQAAAWHLNNGLSWNELEKERINAVFGLQSKQLFTAEQIEQAKAAVERATKKESSHSQSMAGL